MRESRKEAAQKCRKVARRRLVIECFSATFKWILCKLLPTPRENVDSLHFQQLIKVYEKIIKEFKTSEKQRAGTTCPTLHLSVALAEKSSRWSWWIGFPDIRGPRGGSGATALWSFGGAAPAHLVTGWEWAAGEKRDPGCPGNQSPTQLHMQWHLVSFSPESQWHINAKPGNMEGKIKLLWNLIFLYFCPSYNVKKKVIWKHS